MYKISTSIAFVLLIIVGCTTESIPAKTDIPIKSIREKSYQAEAKDGKVVKRDGTAVYNFMDDVYTQYDAAGNEIIVTYYDENGAIDRKFVSTYSPDGIQLQKVWYDSNGSLYRVHKYEPDENGNILFVKSYDSDNNQVEWREKSYDKNNNITSEKFYGSDNQLFLNVKSTYDGQGNKTKEISEIAAQDGTNVNTIYIDNYDKNGLVIEQQVINGDIESKNTYKYNKNGDEVSSLFYFNGDQLGGGRVEYTYDHNGNWTTSTSYSDEQEMTKKERQIEYYK